MLDAEELLGAEAARRARAGEPVRLGFLGGTFDPPHEGHRRLAEAAQRALGLDRLLIVPTGRPAFKQDREVAPGDVRLEMCRALAASLPEAAVCDAEVRRPGVTYAADTLRELREALPDAVEIVYVVGADAALTLPRWHEAAQLANLAAFAVANRPGYELDADALASLEQAGFKVEPFAMPAADVSSSEVRRRIGTAASAEGLVPAEVLRIIEREGLYRKENGHDR